MKKNTPEVWDNLWESYNLDFLKKDIEMEKKTMRYKKIISFLKDNIFIDKPLNKIKSIEIGAGLGTYSIILAQMGVDVTILDYSKNALNYSKKIFDEYGLKANFIEADALNLSTDLKNKYDISMSFGLNEHFLGKDRYTMFKAHLDTLKKGGVVINSVPNTYCIPYQFYKFLMVLLNNWKYGEEYSFTKKEILKFIDKTSPENFIIESDGFLNSFDFFNFLKIYNKNMSIKNFELAQKNFFLDKYLSYSHLIFLKK